MKIVLTLVGIALFDLLGLLMGYGGIARLQRFHWPPFQDGLHLIIVPFPPPPNWLVVSWNSLWGRSFLWTACMLFPLAAFYLSIRKERHFTAAGLLLIWSLASGVMGIWIWLDAVVNATMDLH